MFNLYSGVKDSVCRFISAVKKLNFESFWKKHCYFSVAPSKIA